MIGAARIGLWLLARVLAAGMLWPATAAAANLAAGEVQQIISAAVAEANARSAPATIAVVDRVGNVLGVFRMNGAPTLLQVTSGRGIVQNNGLEQIQNVLGAAGTTLGVDLSDSPGTELSAIAKAITGAYLSSRGNAFTTRTANQIVQEHFNPGEYMASSGPLFGVQFTQLPCSDLSVRFATNAAVTGFVDATAGPKRSPLGLSADPGGLPLYKNGEPVGGIGVESDGVYGIDLMITDYDFDLDEVIALAGQNNYQPPEDIRANRIFVVGKSLRYTDIDHRALRTDPGTAPPFANIDGVLGNLVAVTGYAAAATIDGQTYGDPESGFAQETTGIFNFLGRPVFVLQDATPANRFPPINSVSPLPAAGGLTATEVTTILGNALNIAFSGRAQIRRPLPSHIQVTVSVVDAQGNILGIARTPDGPVFGTDTSLQKARTAAFFSSTQAAAQLQAYDSSGVFGAGGTVGNLGVVPGLNILGVTLEQFLGNVQRLLGGDALANGVAFADRSGGNLSRPFLPDGIDGNGPGPFSKEFGSWSPFNTGLQLDSVVDNIAQHLVFVELNTTDTNARCTFYPLNDAGVITRVANGFQIFPGSVPIYRGSQLIGGIGISGDGVDQDDMVAFLGLHNAGIVLAAGVGNAPQGIRADNLAPGGVQLRYVNCPFKPFIGSDRQNVCQGK
ncbi:MAG: heme-binding protein [Kiloniellales bacterium]